MRSSLRKTRSRLSLKRPTTSSFRTPQSWRLSAARSRPAGYRSTTCSTESYFRACASGVHSLADPLLEDPREGQRDVRRKRGVFLLDRADDSLVFEHIERGRYITEWR